MKYLFRIDASTHLGRGFIHITATTVGAAITIAIGKGYTVHGIPRRLAPASEELFTNNTDNTSINKSA